MVAGDTKRIIVIKNISSNFIEEAILILRSEPASKGDNPEKPGMASPNVENDFILKEAESIINQYIKENGWKVTRGRDRRRGTGKKFAGISANVLVNGLLLAAIAFLLFIICMFL